VSMSSPGRQSLVQATTERKTRAPRLPVVITAAFRESGVHKAKVTVFDLSTTGFRIETFAGVRTTGKVWLTLPRIEALQATVVWVRGDFAGCKFDRPLHPAVLQMLASRTASR
jgi:hypothetical protein